MQSKIFSFFTVAIFVTSSLVANEDILSQNKKDTLNYSYEKVIEDSNKLKKDWINPITYKFIYIDNQTASGQDYTTKSSYISISQPIFKSGGIYYAIKYANSIEKYSKTSIDTQKKELIKQTINLLFELKKLDITIAKQKLLIQNAKLDITRKKEQVLNGILDTSFLDNAILDSNTKQNTLIDLLYQKETMINNLAKLSDKKYEEHILPSFALLDNDNFIQNNIYLKQAKEDIDTSYWKKNMIVSKYLPTVNFTADYTIYHDTDNSSITEDESSSYGFNVTIPLDIRTSYDIQSNKIEYLQKKTILKDKKQEEISLFKNSMAKIKSLSEKVKIAKNDVELYDSLLTQMIEQKSVGMKTESDVQTMINSKKIKTLDVKSLDIDKLIELLEMYSRVDNG